MRPILSVIIVTYQSAPEIEECIRSIPRTLDEGRVEVIMVDNHSSDKAVWFVTRQFAHVKLIGLKQNVGFARANNIGYEASTGDYVLFLNPDTISNRDAFEACLKRLVEDSSIGIISPRLVLPDGSMDLACRRSIPTVWDGFSRAVGLAGIFPTSRMLAGYNLTYLPDWGTYEVGAVNGAFLMCPRRALIRFGIFDEQFFMYGDDLDLCYRCRQAGFKVVYDGRYQITHLKGMSSSRELHRMTREVFIGTKQFYLKHFNPNDSLLTKAKYDLCFWAWQRVALLRARILGYQKARPL
jgi:GT2 family glycosyltransferase